MATDYSTLSDEELDKIIAGAEQPGKGLQAIQARGAKALATLPKATAEEIEPSAWGRGMAALGGALQEPVLGGMEKLRIMFPGRGAAGEEEPKRIGAERAARRATLRELEETPAGMLGATLGKGLPYALAQSPGAVGTAGALTGFLGGGPDRPSGPFSELGASGVQAGIEGLSGWLPAKALQAAGKAVGATTGQLTKEGIRAKEIEEAAQRLGVPRPTFGQTYPNSWVSAFEKADSSHAKLVNEQAEALYNVMKKDTPYGVPDVGGAYLDQLKQAVKNRYDLGAKMYQNVDDIVSSQGLGTLRPTYTANVLKNTGNPGYQTAVEELSKYGFEAGNMLGTTAAQLRQIPLSFADYNTARVATNKAWGNLNRAIDNAQFSGNAPSTELKAARKYLGDLRDALDSDAERWATQNAGNKEAVDAFKNANKYWKEQVVPTVVENPFARKVASQRRGFPTGERATSLSLSSANIPLVDRLLPTMSGPGEDMTVLLRNLPEVRATALTDEAAQTPRGTLHALAQAAEGRRDIGVLEKLASNIPVLSPAVRGTVNLRPIRRFAGAEDVLTGLPRAAAYSTAVPWGSNELQDYEAKLLGRSGR